jgi:hypothetical protein
MAMTMTMSMSHRSKSARSSCMLLAGGGGFRMRKLWAVVLAVSLGLALGACSKCDIPDMLPKSCKTGTVGNEI